MWVCVCSIYATYRTLLSTALNFNIGATNLTISFAYSISDCLEEKFELYPKGLKAIETTKPARRDVEGKQKSP